MNFIWKNIYETGISEIDEQHKCFVNIINRLYNEITKENNHKAIDKIISELKDYAHYHFTSEEKLFETYNYPKNETRIHIKGHWEFIKKIDNIYDNKGLSKEIVGYRVAEFLRKWLIDHILISDMDFANHVKEKAYSLLQI